MESPVHPLYPSHDPLHSAASSAASTSPSPSTQSSRDISQSSLLLNGKDSTLTSHSVEAKKESPPDPQVKAKMESSPSDMTNLDSESCHSISRKQEEDKEEQEQQPQQQQQQQEQEQDAGESPASQAMDHELSGPSALAVQSQQQLTTRRQRKERSRNSTAPKVASSSSSSSSTSSSSSSSSSSTLAIQSASTASTASASSASASAVHSTSASNAGNSKSNPSPRSPTPPPAVRPRLSKKTPLPRLQDYNLLPDQLKNPLFVAIAKVLLVWGNIWQSATQLVEGIRHFNQANLGGRTPKGTVQGAISTAIALSGTLRTFEPIEKLRLGSTTYYRMDRRVFETRAPPTVAPDSSDSDEETTSAASSRRGRRSGGASRAPVSKTKSKPAAAPSSSTAAATSRARRPPKPTITTAAIRSTATTTSQDATNKRKKKTPLSPGWGSDTLSSDSSDEEDTPQNMSRSSYGRGSSSNHSYYNSSAPGSKRTRTGSPDAGPSGSSTRGRPPGRRDSIPNGLKKLPKGYVYDMEINQAALMHLSVNPSQTGEYMQHLKGKNAIANDFPDRRGEFNVDLNQEPSIFSMEQQTGYTYPRLRTSMKERLSKAECEDGYAIADLKHDGSYLGRLFCITDGHGGRACSSFVIATIPGALQVILGKYKPSDLSLPRVQELVRRQITEAVRLIDKEYLDYKKQQYLLYKAKKIVNDPGSDGTTLIVNVFVDKWIICLNLGDSRTMLGSRDSNGRWGVHFHSEDHTPSLERLAQTIYANGGEFVTHDDKIIKFDPNMKNDKKHRYGLKEARIRVRDGASNEYGIPFRTKNGQCASVNLGACIGDVLYKLDPVNPVLSCKPDITFIDTTEIQQGFLLMATDGLWDYVQRGGKVQEQTATVCQFVGDKLDRGWNHQRIVCTLSDRESVASLYSDSIQEFDDFTAILVTFSKQQLLHQQQQRQEYERQQLILQQQRIQEQQILLLQQQHQKQLEQERQLRQEQESKKLEEEKEESKAHGPLEPSPVTEMNGSHGVKIKVEDDGGKAMNLGGGGGSDGGGSLVPEQAPKHSPLLLIKTAPASDEETESDSEWTSTGIRRPLPVQRQAMVHVEVMDTKSTESTKTSSGSVPPPALSPTFSATGTMSDVPTSPTT